MRLSSQQLGRDGEELAVAFLLSKGARILARNWRPTQKGMRGEIDVIAQVGEFLCFVEVKTRKSDEMGSPQEAVGSSKQQQIARLANAYLSSKGGIEISSRFDIVEVWLAPGRKARIEWLENAFEVRM